MIGFAGTQVPAADAAQELGALVLVFGSEAWSQDASKKLAQELKRDELLDLNVSAKVVRSEGATGCSLLNGGRVLATWPDIPTGLLLEQTLEQAGVLSPVKRLTRFLKKHPDHLEARGDLITALRPRLDARLQEWKSKGFPPAYDLPAEEDERIWGPLVREIEQFYGPLYAPGVPLSLGGTLPLSGADRQSRVMRACYLRLRPRLLTLLQTYPSDIWLWSNLGHIEAAFEGQPLDGVSFIHAFLNAVPDLSTSGAIPRGCFGASIFQEAQSRNTWGLGAQALEHLWKAEALSPSWQGPLLGGSPERIAEIRARQQEEAWSSLLAPLIECWVRSGQEGKVVELLSSVHRHTLSLLTPSRLSALAKRIGRPKLGAAWQEALPLNPRPSPHPLSPGPILVYQQQGALQQDRLVECMRRLDSGASMDAAENRGWASFLGWQPQESRWAIINPDGKVLLTGGILPTSEDLEKAWKDSGLQTEDEILDGILRRQPGQPGAVAAKSRWLLQRAARTADQPSSGGMQPAQQVAEAWTEYFRLIKSTWEGPSGAVGVAQMVAMPQASPRDLAEDVKPTLWVGRLLADLESALERQPRNPQLWHAWIVFSPLAGRSIFPLLDRLEPSPCPMPSPLLPPGFSITPWPPEPVLQAACEELRAQERWQGILDFLSDRWEEVTTAQGTPPHHKSKVSTAWNASLTKAMVEASLHLGKPEQASGYLETSRKLKLPEEPLEDMCRLAQTLGLSAWAHKWSKRSTTTPH